MDSPLSPDQVPIKTVHITPTLSRLGGGVASYLRSLVEEGARCGLVSVVAGLHDRYVDQDTQNYPAQRVLIGRYLGPRSVGFSPSLSRLLNRQLGEVDLVHSHGLRSLPSYMARRLARRRGVPHMVSPHGQLDPWILRNHVTRKRIIGWLFENRNLHGASCIHATSNQEARHIRACDIKTPVAVVPIGIDTALYTTACDEAMVLDRWPEFRGKKRLIFMATIYRKKGLTRLAQAWGRLHGQWPDWHLVVSGVEVDDDRQRAEAILASHAATHRCSFIGPVTGEPKKQLLACGDLYVLPTEGENFGITIAESLASQVPVMTSNTTPWEDLKRLDCGWWIDVGVEPLVGALQEAMSLTDAQRREMGRRGRELVEQNYCWPVVVEQMRGVYLWLLGHGEQPDFVYRAEQPIPG